MPENATELHEKHDVDDAVFLVDGVTPLKNACNRHSISATNVTEIATASNVSFER